MFMMLMFYVLSALTLLSGVCVITMKNPVHSVLFLIFAFFNASGLFILMGAEFVAMILVIVYVGAVAVLFLFVIMMMNVNYAVLKQGFIKYLPIGACVALVMFTELFVVMRATDAAPKIPAPLAQQIPTNISNTRAIGNVLYTDYLAPFEVAGVILFVAMVGAIVLTHRQRTGVRKQNISKQVARRAKDGVELVKVQFGQGIK
ncbi:MAG: NADH-quinone oxidoreductase subunit J [Alphaproteobacteria bacterium]|nr:NADH-quinone oxidoreductase subunit J [Alphaproteobacteria bacterium]